MKKRVPLGSLCNTQRKPVSLNDEEIIDYFDISSVDNNRKSLTGYTTYQFSEAPSRARKSVEKGNIIISTVRPNLNAIAIFDKDTDNTPVVSTGFCVLDCKTDVDRDYVFYYCQSKTFVDDMISKATGASYPAVSDKIIREAEIPLYTLGEQKHISATLAKLSAIIKYKKQQINELDNLIKSRFIELFGDRYTNDRKWECKPLYECANFYNGKAHEQVVDENGEYILVTSRCIASDITDYRRTNTLLFPLQVNDIAMVMSDVPNGRALAKCILIDEDNKYTLNQRICCLRDYSFNPIFFYYLLNRHEYFLSFNDGNAQTNLRKDDLLACNIIIPPLELQNQFASFVEQTDKSKFIIQKSLDEMQVLYDKLMQEYFE